MTNNYCSDACYDNMLHLINVAKHSSSSSRSRSRDIARQSFKRSTTSLVGWFILHISSHFTSPHLN